MGSELRTFDIVQRECVRRNAPARAAFGYFWKTKSTLIDAFISESAAYRRAINSGATPEAALAQLKSDREFMAKLRADKTRLQAGFVAIDPATGHVKAWVGSRDFKTDQFDHVAQAGGNRARRSKRLFTAPRSSRGCHPINASPTARWRFPCRMEPCGVLPIHLNPPASA